MDIESQRRLARQALDLRDSMSARLPPEIKELVMDYVMPSRPGAPLSGPSSSSSLLQSPALIPPSNGVCALSRLPTEITRTIFASSLPSRGVIHHPTCTCSSQRQANSKNDPTLGPRRNRISDLMTLNKKLKSEISEVLYEERTFVIHVHEGLSNGGIEFLDSGRQPLQYMDEVQDQRFYKFRVADEFGFQRLKKIIVQIHPPAEGDSRHIAINTYFMNDALCRLLERSAGKNNEHGITSIKIEFPKAAVPKAATGRSAIQRSEHYWWDPDGKEPRATSVHLLSNIRLVLEPFAMLTGCSKVDIVLPANVNSHKPTIDFVSRLESSMTSRAGTIFMDDDVARHIEAARYAMEDCVNWTLHGRGHVTVTKLNETDMEEDGPLYTSDDEDKDDTGGRSHSRKHDLSPASKAQGNDWGREPWEDYDEWEGEQRAILRSHRSALIEEKRAIRAAMSASLNSASQQDAYSGPWPRLSTKEPKSRQLNPSANAFVPTNLFGPPLNAPPPQSLPHKRRKRTLPADTSIEEQVASWEFSKIQGFDDPSNPTFYRASQTVSNSLEGSTEDYYTSDEYIFTTFGNGLITVQDHETARTGLHRTTGGILQSNLPTRSRTSQQDTAPQPHIGHDSGSNPQTSHGASAGPVVVDL